MTKPQKGVGSKINPSYAPTILSTVGGVDLTTHDPATEKRTSQNPKKITSPTSEFPLRQEIEKIPQKYQKNTRQVLKPTPLNPTPATRHERKTEVALQFSECCAAETALQHWLFCSAEVIWPKSCAAANEKLHCNIEKAALQESGAFLPLSCGFQAPTFRHPRLGLAEIPQKYENRICRVFRGVS